MSYRLESVRNPATRTLVRLTQPRTFDTEEELKAFGERLERYLVEGWDLIRHDPKVLGVPQIDHQPRVDPPAPTGSAQPNVYYQEPPRD